MGRSIDDIRTEPDVVIDLRDPQVAGRAEPLTPQPAGHASGHEVDVIARPRLGLILFIALNALNVLDFLLTAGLLRSGLAREGNPFIAWMTLPAKVPLVFACSLLLLVLKPKALIIPVVAYAAVICYTLGGIVFLT
ncbi:MAG: DUF5658 family protein [Actinomycetota bacterium]|nr:DUF5658 family protein [Actinomycetota bacterium]